MAAYPAQAAATQLRLTQSSSSSPLYLHRVYLLYSIYRFYHMLLTTLLAWSLPTLLYTHILLNPPPSHHFTYNILFYTLRTLSLVLLLLSTLHTIQSVKSTLPSFKHCSVHWPLQSELATSAQLRTSQQRTARSSAELH